jgi:hypothetical protein
MSEKIVVFILTAIIGLAFYGCTMSDDTPSPTILPPSITPSPAYINGKAAIIKSADRLIQLQDANGSWDWDVTGQTGPTGITYLNISGITAEGLLDAYIISGDAKYLDAAGKTGDYIITQIGNPVSIVKKTNSSMVLFLYHLYETGGDSKYLSQANYIMSNLLYEDNYWAHNSGNHALDDGISGCTPGELFLAVSAYRGASSAINGIVVWDLGQYIEAAKNIGDTNFSTGLAVLEKQYVEQTGFDSTVSVYILGLSAGIIGMHEAGLNHAIALNKLLVAQKSDGSWEDDNGIVQNTAYAVMALVDAGQTEAQQGVQFILDNQQTNGGWHENDGKEYSEADSEIIQAISHYISK